MNYQNLNLTSLVTNSTHLNSTYVENRFSTKFTLSLLQTFFLILISELGEKTFILILILKIKSANTPIVFISSLIAMCSMCLLSVVIGYFLDYFLYQNFIDALAILIFGGYGISLLVKSFSLKRKTFEDELMANIKSELKGEKKKTIVRHQSIIHSQISMLRLNSRSKMNIYESNFNLYNISDEDSLSENYNDNNELLIDTNEKERRRGYKRKSTGGVSMPKENPFSNINLNNINTNEIVTAPKYKRSESQVSGSFANKPEFNSLNNNNFFEEDELNLNLANTNSKSKVIDNIYSNNLKFNSIVSNNDSNYSNYSAENVNDEAVNVNNANANLDYNLINDEPKVKPSNYFWVFIKSIIITIFADKSQFALISLASIYNFLGVLFGTLGAILTVVIIACFFGEAFARRICEKHMCIVNSIIFFIICAEVIYSNAYINILE